jgi:prefoldin subunit 5
MAAAHPEDMVQDAIEALKASKKQIEELPQVFEDLSLASNRCLTLNQTIRRMSFVSKESVSVGSGPDGDQYRLEMS